jgi:hypothetical protein
MLRPRKHSACPLQEAHLRRAIAPPEDPPGRRPGLAAPALPRPGQAQALDPPAAQGVAAAAAAANELSAVGLRLRRGVPRGLPFFLQAA